MSRWVAVVALVSLLPAGCGRASPPLQSGQLRGANILLITIDTLRRDRVGAYGSAGGLTPAIDRLAASGVRYTRAHSHAPMTLPAHASILTGRTPHSHGLHVNGAARLDDRMPTLAAELKRAGYRTGAFVGAFVLDARYGLGRGFDEYDDRYPQPDAATFKVADRRAEEVVKAAGDWVLQGRGSEPGSARWFAWVHLFDPHTPYDAPPEFRAGRSPYDAEVAYTDAAIGRLLDRLSHQGELEHALVVVTADHGESLGDHGETTHGLFAYESTLAVPLIVNGTGVGRAVVDAPASHADILPTILDLAGVISPPSLDGVSLVTTPAGDRPIYIEALEANVTRAWAPLTGLVSGDWKYVDLPLPELYNLRADPFEAHNLAAAEPARRETMQRALAQVAAGPSPAVAAVPVGEDTAARLRSLGYAAGSAAPARGHYTERDDPKQLVALNERFNSALETFIEGRAEEALGSFIALLRERPDFVTARTSAATALIATGRAADAVALLRAAPAEQASAPEILARLGTAYQQAGQLKDAAAALERSRTAGNQNPELLNDLGVVYAQLGRTSDARAMFQALLQRDPNAAGTWTNLGLAELSARRPDAAADAFRQAVKIDPSNGQAWQGLGASWIGRDTEAAVHAWRNAEKLQPRDYDLLFNLGMVLADSDRLAEALPYLTRFLQEAPRDRYANDFPRVQAAIAKAKR